MTITVFRPKEFPTKAKPIPVFPAVPSTMVPPFFMSPFCRASSKIYFAALSLTEPPGFMNSALPYILQPVSSEKYSSLISGVFPMYLII